MLVLCQVYVSHIQHGIESSSLRTTHKSSVSPGFAKQIIPILRILCYNGSLVTWIVVRLTALTQLGFSLLGIHEQDFYSLPDMYEFRNGASSSTKEGSVFLCRRYVCCTAVSARVYPRCHGVQVTVGSVCHCTTLSSIYTRYTEVPCQSVHIAVPKQRLLYCRLFTKLLLGNGSACHNSILVHVLVSGKWKIWVKIVASRSRFEPDAFRIQVRSTAAWVKKPVASVFRVRERRTPLPWRWRQPVPMKRHTYYMASHPRKQYF
jgi:hypothetical protein